MFLLITYSILRFLCKFSVISIEKLIHDYYVRQKFLKNMKKYEKT
ncbi:hypothetical protein [Candidatus Borrelia fainii]|nr:hypothetical protein [Candidatus Borrelia fainii]